MGYAINANAVPCYNLEHDGSPSLMEGRPTQHRRPRKTRFSQGRGARFGTRASGFGCHQDTIGTSHIIGTSIRHKRRHRCSPSSAGVHDRQCSTPGDYERFDRGTRNAPRCRLLPNPNSHAASIPALIRNAGPTDYSARRVFHTSAVSQYSRARVMRAPTTSK